MTNIGINNDITVGGRKFHVQTGISDSNDTIVSTVFLDGLVIESKQLDVRDDSTKEEKENRVKELHQELITEMEVLYYINEKVKAVKHAPSANKLGMLFLEKNLFDEAVEQFDLAMELNPKLSEVYANLGKTQLMNDRYDAAIEILTKGADQAPDYADIQNYLGIAYLYKEEYADAIAHLEKAIDLNENYIGAQYQLGIACLAQSMDEQKSESSEELQTRGVEYLNKAAEKMLNRQIANFDKVMEKVKDGEYEGAINEFLLSKPRDILTQITGIENEFYLKFMYGGKGKDDVFIAEYVDKLKEAIDKHPEYADVRNNLGVANLIQCRNLFLKSLDEFRAALKINPDFKKAEKNLKLAENDGKGFLILLRAILK